MKHMISPVKYVKEDLEESDKSVIILFLKYEISNIN